MTSPLNFRSSGILLHPTSLAGPFGHGDIGPSARQFVEFLEKAGQRWWQMLPIHPIGGGNSPYDSSSAFAGFESLVSLDDLVPLGLLEPSELSQLPPDTHPEQAQFSEARAAREPLLRLAQKRFEKFPPAGVKDSYEEFLELNNAWVWDYSLFAALSSQMDFRSWETWPEDLRKRQGSALDKAHRLLKDEVLFRVFCQFLFHYQWGKLKVFANQRGVSLMGDIPMFVAHNSADVWANQGQFFLDEEGRRTVQAGVPPDYFSSEGQLWGNPLYRWDVMRDSDYGWWIDRLRRELHKFDAVRIDHFIALSRYWEVPMGADTAKEGRYVHVDGGHFLTRVRDSLGGLPFVAEDLGVITKEVEHLRDSFELPGMRLLHFAFTQGAEAYLPHRHPVRSVAYLGTHDNNTTRGWFEELETQAQSSQIDVATHAKLQLEKIYGYTGVRTAYQSTRGMIRCLMSSPANTVILTLQDLLDQGEKSRMNIPGLATGNWAYRVPAGATTDKLAEEVRTIAAATERLTES